MIKRRKRPIRHPKPQPGDMYDWNSALRQLFLILAVDAKDREIWLCQAIDLQKGCETKIGIRKRDPYNGWERVWPEPI